MQQKTFKTHGPANLILSQRHATILEEYVNHVRSSTSDECSLLLNSSGERIKNSHDYIRKVIGFQQM